MTCMPPGARCSPAASPPPPPPPPPPTPRAPPLSLAGGGGGGGRRPVRGPPRCALWHREGKHPRASARQETVIYGTQHEAEEKFPPPACEKRWKDGGSGGIIVR